MNGESRDTAPDKRQNHWLKRFLADEDGVVLVEYVLLIVGVFIAVNVTIKPLKDALLDLAKDIIIQMHLP